MEQAGADSLIRQNAALLPFAAGAIALAGLLLWAASLFQNGKKLREVRDRLENTCRLQQALLDAGNSLILIKDKHSRYIFVNRAVETFFQRTKEEIIGLTDAALPWAAYAAAMEKGDAEVLENGAAFSDEMTWNSRTFQVQKFPVPMPDGETGLGAYLTDITQARQNEKKQEKIMLRHKILAEMLNHTFESRQEQLDYALREAIRLTESQFGYLFLYEEDTRLFSLNTWTQSVTEACGMREKPAIYPLEKAGAWGEVVRQRKPVVLNSFAQDSKSLPVGHVPIVKFMSVPIMVDQRIVAVIGMANKEEDYTDDDVYHTLLLMSGIWNEVVRKEAEANLALERNRYEQMLLAIGDGVMVVDVQGKIKLLNAVGEKLLGWAQEQVLGKPYQEVFRLSHEQENMPVFDPIASALATGNRAEMENHTVLTSKDGTSYFLENSASPIVDETGHVSGVVLVFRNVTGKKEQQKQIEYLSFHDVLTGLYNRRFFEEELRRLDTPRNLPISFVIGDVNNLKLTNDVFGHTHGDMLLKELGFVLRRICRADDIIARWGGDEFALLLPKTTLEEATRITVRIREEYSKVQIKAVQGSISMGAAIKTATGENILDVVNRAEEEMYLVKTVQHSEMMKGTLDTILQMLYAASPREKEHSLLVGRLCQAFGRRLNMPEDEVKKLRDAGCLHDIGKVVLDSRLLGNQYHLSAQEWNEIKRHPAVGFRILNAFDGMLDLAEIVLAHQEWWDGTGYPKGLKGEEIPKFARIIALAESYERRRGGAENKTPMSKEEALETIRQGKGSHFDPHLADAFLLMIEEEDPDMSL